jgi:hypothetical protein
MSDPQRILRVDDHPLPNRPAAGDGLVRVLTLHRPERKNALSPELIEALLAAITQAGPPVRALVLTGSGDRFCAGGDLGAGGLMGEGMLAQHQQRQRYAELLAAMASSPIPILAAIQGDAMGGGFGQKIFVYPDMVFCMWISRKLGRPVKFVEDRSENFKSSTHGRDHVTDVELSGTRDGKITGLRVKTYAGLGAYLSTIAPGVISI